ncbi:hypothetical protein [Nocardia gipuzkoensis]
MDWVRDVGDWFNNAWDWLWALLHGMTADAWAAVAGWMTALIAGVTVTIASRYAAKQVNEAKKQVDVAQATRRDQAQPNVVVFTESNHTHWLALELVIKNFGSTPARDVRIHFDTTPQVSPRSKSAEATDLWYPEVIPFLAPWQEWRALWDFGPRRNGYPELASRHDVTVSFTDQHGKAMTTSSVLDWKSMEGTTRINTMTVHDIGQLLKAQNEILEEMSKSLASFGDPRKGVWAFGSDAVQELQDRNEAAAESFRQVNEMMGWSATSGPGEADSPQVDTDVPDRDQPEGSGSNRS